MRIFVILLVCTAVGYTGTNLYLSFNTSADVSGYVFLEKNEKFVTPLTGLEIFLIDNGVQQEIHDLVNQYQSPIDSLQKELRRQDVRKEKYEEMRMQANMNPGVAISHPFDYRLYRALQNRYIELLKLYNEAIGEAIRRFFYQKTVTDGRGQYAFKKIPHGRYILYAFHGSVNESHHWFEPVHLTGDTQIHLTRKNLASLFK